MQCACGKIVCIVNKNREIEKLFDFLSEKKNNISTKATEKNFWTDL
jgi:hypothetical protein